MCKFCNFYDGAKCTEYGTNQIENCILKNNPKENKKYVRISFKNTRGYCRFKRTLNKIYAKNRYKEEFKSYDNIYVIKLRLTEKEIDELYFSPYWNEVFRSFIWAEERDDLRSKAEEYRKLYNETM